MSYFVIDEKQMNEPVKRNHQGELNPHFNKPHSPESKEAISKTQKARYELLRKAVNQAAVNDDRIRQVMKEELSKFIKQVIPVKPDNNRPNNIPI
jgi:hypothetical protein